MCEVKDGIQHLHTFEPIKRGAKTYAVCINAHMFAFVSGKDVNLMKYDCLSISRFGGDNAWMVCCEVATDSDSGSVWLILFQVCCANNSCKGDLPPGGTWCL